MVLPKATCRWESRVTQALESLGGGLTASLRKPRMKSLCWPWDLTRWPPKQKHRVLTHWATCPTCIESQPLFCEEHRIKGPQPLLLLIYSWQSDHPTPPAPPNSWVTVLWPVSVPVLVIDSAMSSEGGTALAIKSGAFWIDASSYGVKHSWKTTEKDPENEYLKVDSGWSRPSNGSFH